MHSGEDRHSEEECVRTRRGNVEKNQGLRLLSLSPHDILFPFVQLT